MPLFRVKVLTAIATAAALLAAAPQSGAADGLSGPYLAAIDADMQNDYAAAATWYAQALARDPGNIAMMQNAAVARVAAGDVAGAKPLAAALATAAPDSPIANLVNLADALKSGDFAAAGAIVDGGGPDANPLLSGLLKGWIAVGREDFEGAKAAFDAMNQNEALAAYGQYHKALALALAGDFVSAETLFEGGQNGPLHLGRAAIAAHAQTLAQIDRTEDAIAVIDGALKDGYPAATLMELRARLAAGEEVPFTQVTRAEDGAAEAFLTMAEGLGSADSDRLAIIYARLAQYIRPDLVEASLVAAEALTRQGQYGLATEVLATVPAQSPWFVTSEIRRAEIHRLAGDPDAAVATMKALAEARPDLLEVQAALGDQLRMSERYAELAEAFTRALALIPDPQPMHWGLFYSRAIAYERIGDWPKAEADFRKALELQPGQPSVQNYLGYSLVEQRRNLDEALSLIQQAVAGQPDDGYITDSLGWVLYRLGRYEEALPHMLRAVELEPVDPVINDHLGDVLWMVGRQREAEFQWRRALSFGPAPDLDMDRIRRKLAEGLDAVAASEPAEKIAPTGQGG